MLENFDSEALIGKGFRNSIIKSRDSTDLPVDDEAVGNDDLVPTMNNYAKHSCVFDFIVPTENGC
jgi:hypothetical protein